MATLTVTSKGMVTLSDDVLKHVGIRPGDKISLDLRPDGSGILAGIKAGKKQPKSPTRITARRA